MTTTRIMTYRILAQEAGTATEAVREAVARARASGWPTVQPESALPLTASDGAPQSGWRVRLTVTSSQDVPDRCPECGSTNGPDGCANADCYRWTGQVHRY